MKNIWECIFYLLPRLDPRIMVAAINKTTKGLNQLITQKQPHCSAETCHKMNEKERIKEFLLNCCFEPSGVLKDGEFDVFFCLSFSQLDLRMVGVQQLEDNLQEMLTFQKHSQTNLLSSRFILVIYFMRRRLSRFSFSFFLTHPLTSFAAIIKRQKPSPVALGTN